MYLNKIYNSIFTIVLLLMPICSVYILPEIFKGWHINASMIPLVMGIFICLLDFKNCKRSINENIYVKKAYKYILIIFFYVFINTTLMYFLFLFNSDISYKLTIKYVYIVISEMIIPIIIVVYAIVGTIKLGTRKVMKIILVSMTIIVLYGYIQLFATRTNSTIFYEIYAFISHNLDYIWGSPNNYQYAMVSKRLNLTTPEAAEAGSIIYILYYIFLVPSIINNSTIFKKRFLAIFKIESIMFIISLPIVIFSMSSNNYLVLVTIIFYMIIAIFKKRKGVLKKYMVVIISFIGLITIMIILANLSGDFANRLNYYLTKIVYLSDKSTSTRVGLMVANISIFFKYIINGCGFTNAGLLIPNNLPSWAFNEEITQYIYVDDRWLSGARNFRIISTNGIIGIILLIILVRYINKCLKKYKNNFHNNVHSAFKFFVFISILQGFTSGEFKFVYLWIMCGFFIGAIKDINLDERQVENG